MKAINRDIKKELLKLCKEYPVITLLGPRQSGKTTLSKMTWPNYDYCNLENPENRQLAIDDPKSFLKKFKKKTIFDEIQRVPQLLSYIQTLVDEKKTTGQFILTGSHQLQLRESITQSLAGRTAIVQLLPFSIKELRQGKISFKESEEYIYNGFLPRIYDQKQRPTQAYSNYYQTYVERDVRLLIQLKDSALFEKFMKLLAGRVGQIVDYNSLSNDVGVDAKTIKNWLSILEASFIIYKLSPYFENFGKRVIKSPKYYFTDVGLLSFLLGLNKPEHVIRDPLVGSLFENLIVMECLKSLWNQGQIAHLYFYRDSHGNEIDLLVQKGRDLISVEIKSAATYSSEVVKKIEKLNTMIKKIKKSYLIYNGESKQLRSNIEALTFDKVEKIFYT